MLMQNFSHHVIHINVGQKRSFNGALANATGYLEPGAKLVFGTYSTTRVRIEVPKKFDKLFGYTPFAEGPPKFATRYAIEALFEINIDRLHAGLGATARLYGSLQNA